MIGWAHHMLRAQQNTVIVKKKKECLPQVIWFTLPRKHFQLATQVLSKKGYGCICCI